MEGCGTSTCLITLLANISQYFNSWSPHSTLQDNAKHRSYLGLPSYSMSHNLYFSLPRFSNSDLPLFGSVFFWRQSSPYLYLFYLLPFCTPTLSSFLPFILLLLFHPHSLLFVSLHFVFFFLFLFINFRSLVVLVSTPPPPALLFVSFICFISFLLLSLYFLSLSFSLSPFLPSHLTFSPLSFFLYYQIVNIFFLSSLFPFTFICSLCNLLLCLLP